MAHGITQWEKLDPDLQVKLAAMMSAEDRALVMPVLEAKVGVAAEEDDDNDYQVTGLLLLLDTLAYHVGGWSLRTWVTVLFTIFVLLLVVGY